ncbi:hypothetical protein [Fodinibius saliphilus]|uniref:hypothetical protein n=1 Tax=Fodinibius saliphilus TaxID=1920650 RepID=UPI001109B6AC|nr:hypothetical protein [Fodinibius saliphilus]
MGDQFEKRRDAIIYVPALSKEHGNDSINAMANRLAAAFDRNAESGEAEFYIKKEAREDFREFDSPRFTIIQKGDEDIPVVDLYELDYRDLLLSPMNERKPVVHLLSILWSCLGMVPRLIKGMKRTSKTSLEKWQVFYGWAMAGTVSTYFFLLLFALGATLSDFSAVIHGPQANTVAPKTVPDITSGMVKIDSVESGNTTVADTTKSKLQEKSIYSVLKRLFLWLPVPIVIVVAALGLFSKEDFKQMISELGKELAAAENYLSVDEKRSKIRGQFATLLEHISEKEGEGLPKYDNIHLLSYSFGSIIALDSLFPNDSPLVPRFQMVDSLTTIGTPYDFISTYWPEYFNSRMQYDGVPRNWINIYMKSDVFGSNFTDSKTGETSGIEFHPDYCLDEKSSIAPNVNRLSGPNRSLKDYGWFNRLRLIGFKTHSQYWEGEAGFDVNSIDIVVQELFTNEST